MAMSILLKFGMVIWHLKSLHNIDHVVHLGFQTQRISVNQHPSICNSDFN